jgi:hypothetical protein
MSNDQQLLRDTTELPVAVESLLTSSLSLFSLRIKSTWVVMIAFTCISELVPIGPMPPPLFYLYYAMKVAAFFALGFLAPLAFHRLNGIGLGFTFSLLSACLIEVIQSLPHNGHSFHWYELAGKFALISVGFAFALECRYERRISFGPVQISLQTNGL